MKNENLIKKAKEISKKLSFNDIEDEEGLDHPKPLISDCEDNLIDLKAQFINKANNKKKLNSFLKYENNKELNMKNVTKSCEFTEYLDSIYENQNPNIQNKKNSKIVNGLNILNNKNNERFRPLKKNYKSETITRKQLNEIKSQINNKINFIIKNDDTINNNTEKKQKQKNESVEINEPKNVFNYKHKQVYNNFSANNSKNLKEIKTKIMNNKINNQIRNKTYNYMNNSKNDNNLNKAQQYQNTSNLIDNLKQQVHSVFIPMSKKIYKNENIKNIIQEENENNNSQENIVMTEPNVNKFQNQSNMLPLTSRKIIEVENFNKTIPNKEIKILQKYKESEINKIGINNNNNKKSELNDLLNISKIKSNEINNYQKPYLFNNELDNQRNNQKYRTKTFERGGKFNNVQTTYVVISKNKNTKETPKTNLNHEFIDYNKLNMINPTQSANKLTFSKFYKKSDIPQRYSNNLQFQRINENDQGIYDNKKYNNKTMNHYYNNKNIIFNNNDYDNNYRNNIESSLNEKGVYTDKKSRNFISFNNSSNNKNSQIQNQIYEYGYYFNNDNSLYNNNPFNSIENDYN